MKKFMPQIIAIIAAAFFLVTFSYVVSLTYSAAAEIFGPQSFNTYGALVLFDFATLTWGLIFAYRSHTKFQFAFAFLGFLLGALGTYVMVSAEMGLASGTGDTLLLRKNIAQAITLAAVAHTLLGYLHHATGKEIDMAIRSSAAKAEFIEDAMHLTDEVTEQIKGVMSVVLMRDFMKDIIASFNLPMLTDEMMNKIIPQSGALPAKLIGYEGDVDSLWQAAFDIDPEDVESIPQEQPAAARDDNLFNRFAAAFTRRGKKDTPAPAPKSPAPKSPAPATAPKGRVYLRTNIPNMVVGIERDGTGFKIERLLPGMRFVTPSPLSQEAIWEIKDQLMVRMYPDGSMESRHFKDDNGDEILMTIAEEDYRVVALPPAANPTDAGEKKA